MSKPELNLDVVGTTGLKQSGGYVNEEFLPQLKGRKGAKLYNEMSNNSPQIAAVRLIVKALVSQVEWSVETAEEPSDPMQAEDAKTLIEQAMNDMEHTWADFISEVLTMLEFGWSFFDIVYKLRRGPDNPGPLKSKYSDGRVGWRRIELRAQDSLERWEFAEDNTLIGMWQMDEYQGKHSLIKSDRAVHFRTEKNKNNPEGRSFYRGAVVSYLRLKHTDDFESIGVERDLAGMPILEVPMEIMAVDASPKMRALRAELEKALAEIKRDERDFLLVPASMDAEGKPTGWKFTLVQSGGARQLDTTKIKEGYKTDILMSCLVQFLLLGQQQATGSFALASSQTSLFAVTLGAILKNICETFTTSCIEPLCFLNQIAPENRPKLGHGDIETPSLEELGGFLKTLFDTALLDADEDLRKAVYTAAKLPYKPKMTTAPGAGGETADDLLRRLAPQNAAAMGVPPAGAPGAAPGGVKSADQLIAEAQGKTPAPAGGPVKTADQLIEEAKGKPPA